MTYNPHDGLERRRHFHVFVFWLVVLWAAVTAVGAAYDYQRIWGKCEQSGDRVIVNGTLWGYRFPTEHRQFTVAEVHTEAVAKAFRWGQFTTVVALATLSAAGLLYLTSEAAIRRKP